MAILMSQLEAAMLLQAELRKTEQFLVAYDPDTEDGQASSKTIPNAVVNMNGFEAELTFADLYAAVERKRKRLIGELRLLGVKPDPKA